MRGLLKLLLVLLGGVLLWAGLGLPEFGDPHSPASTHVGAAIAGNAYHDAHTPNMVTVMIADYRSFDTLGEVVVVFVAGLACFLMLRGVTRREGGGGW